MVFNNNIDNVINIDNVTKKKIDTILLMLGREITLPNESLKFYHSSPVKFETINNIGTWYSPIKIKEKSNVYTKYNIYTKNKPLWFDNYDFQFINKKPLKLLVINTYTNDIISHKLKTMCNIINDNIKLIISEKLQQSQNEEDSRFLLDQENDPEYLLAYHLCKYSSFDGWITNASFLGYCMLKKECLKKLKLLSVTEPLDRDDNHNIIMYYTSKQWKEQFYEGTQVPSSNLLI